MWDRLFISVSVCMLAATVLPCSVPSLFTNQPMKVVHAPTPAACTHTSPVPTYRYQGLYRRQALLSCAAAEPCGNSSRSASTRSNNKVVYRDLPEWPVDYDFWMRWCGGAGGGNSGVSCGNDGCANGHTTTHTHLPFTDATDVATDAAIDAAITTARGLRAGKLGEQEGFPVELELEPELKPELKREVARVITCTGGDTVYEWRQVMYRCAIFV